MNTCTCPDSKVSLNNGRAEDVREVFSKFQEAYSDMMKVYQSDLIKAFSEVINMFGMESWFKANVPDFVLAGVAINAICSFTENFKGACNWYGVHLEPGDKYFEEGK